MAGTARPFGPPFGYGYGVGFGDGFGFGDGEPVTTRCPGHGAMVMGV